MPKISSFELNQALISRNIKNLPIEIQIQVLTEYLKKLDVEQALEISKFSKICQLILRDRRVWSSMAQFTTHLINVIEFYQGCESRDFRTHSLQQCFDFSKKYAMIMKNETSTFEDFADFFKKCKSFLLDPKTCTFNQYTPLIYAAAYDRGDLIGILLSIGVNVNQTCSSRVSPLHYAVQANAKDAVALLIQGKANVNLACNCGHTPLHFIHHNDSEIAIKLVLSGANPQIMANNKATPLDYAKHFNRDQVVSVLKQANAFNTVKPMLTAFKRDCINPNNESTLIKREKRGIV